MDEQIPPTSPSGASFDADHMSHFSNADYDWMGVLDGCFAPSVDGNEIHHVSEIGEHTASGHAFDLNEHDNSAEKMSVAAEAAMNTPESQDDKKPAAKTTAATACRNNDRVERKRNREKQRRLDTNEQFTALASIVREIETNDFMEEAQFHSLYELTQGGSEGETVLLTDGNKKLKTETSLGKSIQDAISASGTYSASNRVELIARTSLMLSQFRAIRKKRNEELRDARRQNCEMKKEIEDLRRMVAHYKTMGMGVQKPQDKIMMMVPMMVPQDAVNSVSAGFPAAHLCGGSFAPHWMPSSAQTMPSNTNTAFHQQSTQAAQTANPFVQLSGNQNVHNQTLHFENGQQGIGQSPGAAALPQTAMLQAQAPPGMVHNHDPTPIGHAAQQFAQMSVPTQLPMSSLNQGIMQPQPVFHQNSAMQMMFPHTTMGVATPAGLNPTNADTSIQQTNTLGQQLSSDKPSPSTHQGGRGNLAHCA